MVKILKWNFIFLLIAVLVIELIFGGWLKNKKNFSYSLNRLGVIHGRQLIYDAKNIYGYPKQVVYTRDSFGFRGSLIFNNPQKIDILTVGGSTTDQRLINDGDTWQDVLQKKLQENGIKTCIANAGVDGHSTFGHIASFKEWWEKLPQLKPKVIIFYVGINDFLRNSVNPGFDENEKGAYAYIKRNSIIFNLLRLYRNNLNGTNYLGKNNKVIEKAANKVILDTLVLLQKPDLHIVDSIRKSKSFKSFLASYVKRIKILEQMALMMNATPIFVLQPTATLFYHSDTIIALKNVAMGLNGYEYTVLKNEMDSSIKAHTQFTIDLAKKGLFEQTDFYDLYHMLPSGSLKVGRYLSDSLVLKYPNILN